MQRPPHSRDIGKGFVNGILFHLIGKAPHDVEHPPGEEAVGLIVGRQYDQAGANFFCLMQGDASFDSYLFGGITGAGDYSTFCTGDDWLPSQLGMNGFLTGREECVAVNMNNGLGPGMKAEYSIVHDMSSKNGHGHHRTFVLLNQGNCLAAARFGPDPAKELSF